MRFFSLLFSPKGTIDRGEFTWGFFLSLVFVTFLCSLLWAVVTIYFAHNNWVTTLDIEGTLFALRSQRAMQAYYFRTTYTQIILAIFFLGKISLFWMFLCLLLKRLSDLEISRWLALVFYVFALPVLLYLPENYKLFSYVCWGGLIVFCYILFFWPSRIAHLTVKPKTVHDDTVFGLLLSPQGSIERWPFLAGQICIVLISIAVAMVISFGWPTEWNELQHMRHTRHLPVAILIILLPYALCVFWIELCLCMKRLSDLLLTRWLAVLPYSVNILLVAQSQLELNDIHINIGTAVNILEIVILCFFLVLALWPSRQTGPVI